MQILLLLSMTQVMGGFSDDKLMKCIMDFLLNEGGMSENENRTKLVAFGANGVILFHGNYLMSWPRFVSLGLLFAQVCIVFSSN
jgi:hypothetical protein